MFWIDAGKIKYSKNHNSGINQHTDLKIVLMFLYCFALSNKLSFILLCNIQIFMRHYLLRVKELVAVGRGRGGGRGESMA